MSISVQKLVKNYGALTVVHGVSFEVEKGEFVSLLGPSGCGKTTTLRCIAGLEQANGGTISIDGQVVSAPTRDVFVPPHQRNIGMVFQSYAIWPHMSVADNVGFPLATRKVPAKEVREQAEEALDVVGMLHLKDRMPSQLSGGQQQRVALARAIVGRPSVLLFDEPLSNLDAKLRETTRAEIRRLQRRLDVAAVYVTHDQEEALSMSDRVIVMQSGNILQMGTPKELYRRPANRFVADFVGRATFIPVTRDGSGWRIPTGDVVRLHDEGRISSDAAQLMVRPEAVSLGNGGSAGADIGTASLRGTVQEALYMGAYTEYTILVGDQPVKVHSVADLDVGEEASLFFSPSDCRLMDVAAEPARGTRQVAA